MPQPIPMTHRTEASPVSYKIHHLNCATLCPQGSKLITGKGTLFENALLSCHCLLIESHDGLILVDTGFGVQDMNSIERMGVGAAKALNPKQLPEETAVRQLESRGFKRTDVRHIILTHLDVDHAGGIADFPNAQIHLLEAEHSAATKPLSLQEKFRYQRAMWSHNPQWQLHKPEGETWFGFDSVRMLENSLHDILLIPLLGHSRGHCGVAVASEEGWLLHCGDAYFHKGEMNLSKPKGTLGMSLIQAMDDTNRKQRISNQRRLRDLKRGQGNSDGGITLFCSHDHDEFNECASCKPRHLITRTQ